MRKIVLFILLSFVSVVYGQEHLKISKSEFKIDNEKVNDAWKCINAGDKDYDAGGGLYTEAMKSYLLAYDYNTENAELNYKIGVSCLFGTKAEKALQYLLKAYELKPEVATDILLLSGRAYQFMGDYGKAIDCYNMYSDKYHESNKFNSLVNRYINECNTAIEASVSIANAELFNLGAVINSKGDDYSAVIANEGELLYFTTRRNIDTKRSRQDADMKWDENIYMSARNGNVWTMPVPAGEKLISESNEGVLAVNRSGDKMFIYAGYSDNGDIYMSLFEKGKWSKPKIVDVKINSKARETSFSISEDGNKIFFTSDKKKGGFGGRDIYITKRIRKNKWSRPANIGENINSALNEESVCISANADSLWFSSNGHDGIGGYDVYLTVKDAVGSWTDPLNLGMPINSQANDLFYKPSPFSSDEAWISSDRSGGIGGLDIYKIIFSVPDSVIADEIEIVIIESDSIPIVVESDTIIIIEKPDTTLIIVKPDTTLISGKLSLYNLFHNKN